MKNFVKPIANKIALALIVSFCALFFGCATKIQTTVLRPAEIDLAGAKTISILPFSHEPPSVSYFDFETWLATTKRHSQEYELDKITDHFKDMLEQKVINAEFYDLTPSDDVQRAIGNGRPVPCDIYLTGYITDYKNDVITRQITEKKNVNGSYVDQKITQYNRKIYFKLTYEFIDAKTNRIIASETKGYDVGSGWWNSSSQVAEPIPLLQSTLNTVANQILAKVQPYKQYLTLALLSDKTKDPLMKEANELAKNDRVDASMDLFQRIYKEKGYMEAGYNAALLMQAAGDLKGAEALMSEVAEKFNEPKADSSLAKIRDEIRSKERLEKQIEQRDQ